MKIQVRSLGYNTLGFTQKTYSIQNIVWLISKVCSRYIGRI